MSLSKNVVVETKTSKTLSGSATVLLVEKFLKYMLFQKGQIPCNWDRLEYIIKARNAKDQAMGITYRGSCIFSATDKYYVYANRTLEGLGYFLHHLKYQLNHPEFGVIKEVAMVFGDTLYNPTEIIRFELPEYDIKLPEIDMLYPQNILRNVIVNAQTTAPSLTKEIPLTIFHILMKKEVMNEDVPEIWFRKRLGYKLEHRLCPTITLKFPKADADPLPELKFLSLNVGTSNVSGIEPFHVTQEEAELRPQEIWFNSNVTFRGFKDSQAMGMPVSELLLKS